MRIAASALAAVFVLALAGCGSAVLAQRRAALSALIGRPEIDAVQALGVPDRTYPLGDAQVLVWQRGETWWVPGAPGITSYAAFHCTTSLVVRHGVISSFDLRGNGCAS